MATAARVFSGYRRLFRARKILFQGDERAMRESRIEIRKNFDMNRAASDPAHIEGLLTMVDEAEDMLLHGIVRGELNDQTGNYGELSMGLQSFGVYFTDTSCAHFHSCSLHSCSLHSCSLLTFRRKINHRGQNQGGACIGRRSCDRNQQLGTNYCGDC